jgi:hypothetical protein
MVIIIIIMLFIIIIIYFHNETWTHAKYDLKKNEMRKSVVSNLWLGGHMRPFQRFC